MKKYQLILLSVLSGFLFAIGWPSGGFPGFLFIAFIPLFFVDCVLREERTFSEADSIFNFVKAKPADYNLYTKMEIPELSPKETSSVNFVPVTDQSRTETSIIVPKIQDLSYQIDNIYNQENLILPQNGSIDFILTITPDGITQVDYRITEGKGFSKSFISKCKDAIKRWQISSPVKLQYTLSRNFLMRP